MATIEDLLIVMAPMNQVFGLSNKAKLTTNVSKLNDQVAAVIDTKRKVEEEAARLREALQEKEADKQFLLRKIAGTHGNDRLLAKHDGEFGG